MIFRNMYTVYHRVELLSLAGMLLHKAVTKHSNEDNAPHSRRKTYEAIN